jgi:hypothetical protein
MMSVSEPPGSLEEKPIHVKMNIGWIAAIR